MYKTRFKVTDDTFSVQFLRNNSLRTWNVLNDSKLFQKKYRQKFLDFVGEYFHHYYPSSHLNLVNDIQIFILHPKTNVLLVDICCPISKIIELVEIFADKRLRDQITREAFRYV